MFIVIISLFIIGFVFISFERNLNLRFNKRKFDNQIVRCEKVKVDKYDFINASKCLKKVVFISLFMFLLIFLCFLFVYNAKKVDVIKDSYILLIIICFLLNILILRNIYLTAQHLENSVNKD